VAPDCNENVAALLGIGSPFGRRSIDYFWAMVRHSMSAAGLVWDTDQLRQEFEMLEFTAPFVVVYRKSDVSWAASNSSTSRGSTSTSSLTRTSR